MNTNDSSKHLANFFGTLSGGMLVAISGKTEGALKLLIEHKTLLENVAESWGRLVVIFPGCSRLTFRTEASRAEPLETLLPREKPELCGARFVKESCEIHFRLGTAHGLLEIEAPRFEIMLGGGRKLTLDDFLDEVGAGINPGCLGMR